MTEMEKVQLPRELSESIGERPDVASASTELSKYRTRLSTHRTQMSEHRTDLSEQRTSGSKHRTDLSFARSHLANERTHLAQLRTAFSLMTFGITLNRFSIYLQENNRVPASETRHGMHMLRDAANVGIGMVVLGVLFLAWSFVRYRRVSTQIENLDFRPAKFQMAFLTLVSIFLGAGSAIWLFRG